MRRVLVLGVSHPTPRGRNPDAPKILGFPFIYAYTVCRRTTKFNEVTYVGRGVYLGLGVNHASAPKRAEFQGSPIIAVPFYLCLHHLTQNDQIRHDNTFGDGCVFSRSVMHLHKCVARFLSDSRVHNKSDVDYDGV